MESSAAKEISDEELVNRFLHGHSESFWQLVERYEGKVFHTAVCLTPSAELAESVLNEVFSSLIEALRLDRGQTPLFEWLMRRTLDLSTTALIESAGDVREESIFTESIEQQWEILHESRPSLLTALRRAANDLDSDERYVFVLRDIHSMPLGRIAQLLDISELEVRLHLRRARRKILDTICEATSPTNLAPTNLAPTNLAPTNLG